MDIDGERSAWILRVRARRARETSAQLRQAAQETTAQAAALRDAGHERRDMRRRAAARRLELTTALSDEGVVEWSRVGSFIDRDASLVGRDQIIEEAKTLLCDAYGISRGAAFDVLRGVSSRQNKKLSLVARTLVDAAHAENSLSPESWEAG